VRTSAALCPVWRCVAIARRSFSRKLRARSGSENAARIDVHQARRASSRLASGVASRVRARQDAAFGDRLWVAADGGWIVLTESLVAGCRVLVADDSPFALELIKAILDKAGCTQLTGAGGGREALALAGQSQFDVVLLDVTMPDMNGYEVARQLRATTGQPGQAPRPVIVMLSGRDIVEVDLGAREAGADGVMAKPVDRRKLLELLETLLQQRRALVV